MSEYKSKFFFTKIYSIQFRLMKGFLTREIDVNEACVRFGLWSWTNSEFLYFLDF